MANTNEHGISGSRKWLLSYHSLMKEGERNTEKFKQKEGRIWTTLAMLLLSLSFIGVGLYLLINNLIIVGTDARYPQPTANGGGLFLVVGLIFLIVTYFNLSPFSRVRKLIEGNTRFRRRK